MLMSFHRIWRQAGATTRDPPASEGSEHESTYFIAIAIKLACCAMTYLYDINV